MFHSPINYLFSFFILLIFTSTSVFSSYCYNQRTCYSEYSTSSWCCDVTEICGSYDGSCESNSVLSIALIVTTIIGLVFFCIICLICCLRSCQQRQHVRTIYRDSSGRIVASPYQQHNGQGPVRVVHVRPFYNVGSLPPSYQHPGFYEEPPPSYESVTANLPTVHQSSTPTV